MADSHQTLFMRWTVDFLSFFFCSLNFDELLNLCISINYQLEPTFPQRIILGLYHKNVNLIDLHCIGCWKVLSQINILLSIRFIFGRTENLFIALLYVAISISSWPSNENKHLIYTTNICFSTEIEYHTVKFLDQNY